jgi:hypothetical protein
MDDRVDALAFHLHEDEDPDGEREHAEETHTDLHGDFHVLEHGDSPSVQFCAAGL